MQVFEFHFNPKAKENLFFDTFCYEPKNLYEKKLGNLYAVGYLKNALPQNSHLLENLAQIIKEKYYISSSSSEKSFKDSLKKANEYLKKISERGDVSWLSNLSFAAVSLQDLKMNFTKIGDLNIFLLRKGQVIDIDQKLKFDDLDPYSMKIFGNIVSGKLAENDVIALLTKDVFKIFLEGNLLHKIAEASAFNQKRIKEILNERKEQLLKASGICLLIALTKEESINEKETIKEEKEATFSFKKLSFKLPKISLKVPPLPKPEKLLSLIKLPKLKFKMKNGRLPLNKKVFLILALFFFLISGFFVFQRKESKQLEAYQKQLDQIENKINQGEALLAISGTNSRSEKNANILLKSALDEISPLVNIIHNLPNEFAKKVSTVESNIINNLNKVNKLQIIENPELFIKFAPREFIPQNIISSGNNLYLYTPYSKNILKIDSDKKEEMIESSQKFDCAVALSNNSLLFFSKPNLLIPFKDNELKEPFLLSTPYDNFYFDEVASYLSNLYFLDKKIGKIVKYSYVQDLSWGPPQLWLNPQTKTTSNIKSMAVNGSVWLLTKDDSIEHYHSGNFQEAIKLDIFPEQKDFSKIYTSLSLPYLYIMEPIQKRIIITDKSGKIIKQIQSPKFDTLLDFSVSKYGKTIWLLNGLELYKVSF